MEFYLVTDEINENLKIEKVFWGFFEECAEASVLTLYTRLKEFK